jgi:hypothetical protein
MIEKTREELAAVGVDPEKIGTVLADAGYCSDENLAALPTGATEYLVNTIGEKDRRSEPVPAPRGRIPKSATARERMDRKLRTKRGRALYKRRGVLVEPVFGMIKDARRIGRFMRRGLHACAHEWKLICTTHNLLKLWRHGALAGCATTG